MSCAGVKLILGLHALISMPPPSVCDVTFDLSQNYENLHNTVYRTVKILFKTSMAPQDRAKIKYDPPLTGLADEECFLCI